MSSQFLIIRPDDLVIIGVRWSGFTLAADVAAGPRIIATSDTAQIILTFPPQAMNEALFREHSEAVLSHIQISWSALAGPSHLAFNVSPGTIVPLTADGILAVLSGTAIVSGEVEAGLESSAIEILYGLIVSAVARSGGQVVASHPTLPVASRSSVVGLWQTQLRAGNAQGPDARLFLKPLRAPLGLDPNFDFGFGVDSSATMPPMLETHRVQILRHSAQEGLPKVTRLNLSALGGTLQASAVWSDFEWDHDLSMGRDQEIRFLSKGTLYPFGHRATFLEMTRRGFAEPPPHHHEPPPRISHAGLHVQRDLFVTEPVRAAVKDDARLTRQFPFDEVEILERRFGGIAQPGDSLSFVPQLEQFGQPLLFPLRCAHSSGDVFFSVPLVFVPDFATAPDLPTLAGLWQAHSKIALPGIAIDLVRSAGSPPMSCDVQEVHAFKLGGVRHTDGFRPVITEFEAELPAVRALLAGSNSRTTLVFNEAFRDLGNLGEPFRPLAPIAIDFAEHPERSGALISPKFTADVISRSLGPVPKIAAAGLDQSALSAFEGATLLGLPLTTLIDIASAGAPRLPPKIVPVLENGKPVGGHMEWILQLKSAGPLKADTSTKLTLTVETSPVKSETTCRLEHFSYELPPGPGKLLTLNFGAVVFTQKPGSPIDLQIIDLSLAFSGALALLQDLAQEVQRLLGPRGPGVTATPDGIIAAYSLGIPSVSCGTFVLRNVAIHLGVNVPFSNRPVTASVGFGSRDNPFGLTVLGLGGGGYIDVRVGGVGLIGFEASLEFGALVEINFVIVSAEVHAFGGVRFTKLDGTIVLEAFIRIGGSVDVLGLVSVSVELLVQLSYDPQRNRLIGHASIVVEVDLTLFSESVTLDSGEWTLAGSDSSFLREPVDRALVEGRGLAAWQRYQEAFVA
jgi:hypothetical protein